MVQMLILILTVLFAVPAAVSEAYKLPDSGQTKCYATWAPYNETLCTDTGQDGAYNINPMSYTDNGGKVTDNNTGLVWQKQGADSPYNWYQASGTAHDTYNPAGPGYKDVCGELSSSSLGGFSNWRLPSRTELLGIVDYSVSLPAIQATHFPNTQDLYWVSDPDASNAIAAWFIYFGYGYSGFNNYNAPKDNDQDYHVRCVSGGQTGRSYTDNGDTVTDSSTGLEWQRCPAGLEGANCDAGLASGFSWTNALSYCGSRDLGGHTDWRLPNIKELESLADLSRYNPAINSAYFPGAEVTDYYWSSTTNVNSKDKAWYVYFFRGKVFYESKYGTFRVRCVRAGGINTCPATAVSTGGNPYITIHEAYSAAATEGQVIQMQALDFTESDLDLGKSISITLMGGYECGFGSNPGFTTIYGAVTISGGTVTVENVVVM